MVKSSRFVKIIVALMAVGHFCGNSLVFAGGITLADVRECSKCIGDFAGVIPVVQFGVVGLRAAGVLPDEEKEFRARIEAQNREILSGISSLSKGIDRIEVSLQEIRDELSALRTDVNAIPERNRSSDLYVDAYMFLKRTVRVKFPTEEVIAELRRDFQDLLDEADAVASLSSADLQFYAACSLMCIAARKCYEAEMLLANNFRIPASRRDFYDNASDSLEVLLTHSEKTFDLLAKREQLKAQYATVVDRLVSSTGEFGFVWAEDKTTCCVGIRSVEKREIKNSGFRIVLLKTEKKYETIFAEFGYELGDPLSETVPSAVDRDKVLVSIFKPLSVQDFDAINSAEVYRQKSAGKLTFVEIDASAGVENQLKKGVDVYNKLAEESRRIAFQVTMADGLAKWLSESRQVLASFKTAKK